MDVLYSYYLEYFQSFGINEAWAILLWYAMTFAIVAVLLIGVVLVLVLVERKLLALFTVRKGPNRVGFWGCLQTVADAIKLLFKEDIIPDKADKFLFWIAPILVFAPVMAVWGLIPWDSRFCIFNSIVGVLLFMAILTFPTFGILLAGYSSNNKYSLIGAFRACVQTISYEIPLVMSVLSIVVLAQTLNINNIILAQSSNGIFGWNFIPAFVGMVVFFVCAIAQMNRTPFDLPEAESELVCGYNVEYSGMKFAMFFLAEYAETFIISLFMAILFFGGYLSPFGGYIVEQLDINFVTTQFLIYIEQFSWLIIKTAIILFVIIWIRATLPRLRADQLTAFAWKVLLPLSIINFFVVSVIKYMTMGASYV
ncbi:MAG: NADH-quinone oxidoreductase subunit NuoH [Candidatus Gastranaerophilales bacterium]|nr:NADH-quinone oxidoreductase subunit NuoH [Candidatus Gastranaerophilales bacterium]